LFLYFESSLSFLFFCEHSVNPSHGSDGGGLQRIERTLDHFVRYSLPVLSDISQQMMVQNNPWTQSKISKGVRGSHFRSDLMKLYKYDKKNKPKCCVTGIRAGGNIVSCAHLIPCTTTQDKLDIVGLTTENLNQTENTVFLVKPIEEAFDRLQLSFMKTNPLLDKLRLKIWDGSIRGQLVAPDLGATEVRTIGDFEDSEILLEHRVYKRLLAYQAFIACKKHGGDVNTLSETLYGSPGLPPTHYPFYNQSQMLLKQFQTVASREIDEESDDEDRDERAAEEMDEVRDGSFGGM